MATLNYTEKSQAALVEAQRTAEEGHFSSVEGLHLLAALVGQEDGIVPAAIRSAGVDARAVSSRVESEVAGLPKAYGSTQIAASEELRRALQGAEKEAQQLHDEYISTEHLLLGLAGANGAVANLLNTFGLARDAILAALTKVRGNQRVTDATPEDKFDALSKYGRDLTEAARRRQARPGDRP